MNTLILNGSPRKNGDTSALLGELSRHLSGKIVTLSPYFDNIGPCTDCRFCWRSPGCAIHDDMDVIYDGANVFDNVVVASPVYFSDLTPPMLALCSRFQTYYAAKRFRASPVLPKPKRGAILLVGGGDGDIVNARDSARRILRYLNAECAGEITSLSTDTLPASEDAAALARIRELAALLGK